MKKIFHFVFLLLLAAFFLGCGHSQTYKVGLMSFGDLEGKVIPDNIDGTVLTGKDCCKIGSDPYFLSDAVSAALGQTEYDTLIDVEVTNKTGVLVWSNCVIVTGKALDSKTLTDSGGE